VQGRVRHAGHGGYDDDGLAKIAHRNWIRVLRETWGE